MTILEVPAIPDGLDARPVIRFTLHCSQCGKPNEGEFGPTLWPGEFLDDLSKYAITEDGWHLDVDGRKLVCPECEVGWCVGCGEPLFTWQSQKMVNIEGDTYHEGCSENGQ